MMLVNAATQSTDEIRILLLEDNPVDAELVEHELKRAGFQLSVCRVETEKTFTDAIKDPSPWDVILADYSLPQFNAKRALAVAREMRPDVPFILVSGTLGEDVAVETLRQGATDFVLKGRMERLGPVVRRALREAAEQRQRQKAERALQERELFLRAIFDSEPECVKVLDKEGLVREMNLAGLRMLDAISLDQVAGQSIFRFVIPEDHEPMRTLFKRTLEGESGMLEVRTVGLHGTRRWMEQHTAPLRDSMGEIQAVLAVTRDITQRRQAEIDLRQSAERYRDLMEGARDAIFTVSPDGTIISLNMATETMTGLPRGEWIGNKFLNLVHPDDLRLAFEMFELVMRGERPPSFELRIPGKAGRDISIEFTLTPRWVSGKVAGALGVGRDISERKRLEEQLLQAQKMEAIGQLSGGIAHDFNNILTVIHGNASLLQFELRGGESVEYARQILQAAERAAGLTRQLLLFSRKQVMQTKALNLNEVVANITKMLQRILGEHISLNSHYASNLPLVRGDAGMFEQVLVNLVVNARDAMPDGGVLTISTEVQSFDEVSALQNSNRKPGGYVCLKVADTGHGIAPEHLPHVFEPFFTTKEVGKGTGLGLASVYGILQQHQGWIELETQVGKGTTFHIYVPASAHERRVDAHKTSSDKLPRGSETLLVVEDEAALRHLTANVLQRCGYRVLACANGVEAMRLWPQEKDNIDLLFTDMVMPEGVLGSRLAEVLLAEKPDLKVIFTSGYSAKMNVRGMLLEEGRNFLQKPYTLPKLAQTIRERLDRTVAP